MYALVIILDSGTGSVGSAFASTGWGVVSLDSDPKIEATIHEGIRTWVYTILPSGYFDAIWASLRSARYSCARRGAQTARNVFLADVLVQRPLAIIEYFSRQFGLSKNPISGLCKDRPFMEELPYRDVAHR